MWAILGVLLLVADGFYRVIPVAVRAFDEPFTAVHWIFFVFWIVFMAYTEGYRGFQLRFAPRVVVRTAALARNPRPWPVVFAPLFAIGFFWGTRRRKIVAWGVTAAIVSVIVAVRFIPQPWRGIVDAGVVVGLGWGTVALLWFVGRALAGHLPDIDPQLPEGDAG